MHTISIPALRQSVGARATVAALGALLLLTAAAPSVGATGYAGYTGDIRSGILVCDPAFGAVSLTDPDVVISSDQPNVYNEQQWVYTTSMLFKWDGAQWQSVSGWSPWQTALTNDVMASFNLWYELDGSSWSLANGGPSWYNLGPGYYATFTWMWGAAHDGVAAGWAQTTSFDSLNPYCQI